MRVTVALLANRADVRDGLLHIEGGGWEFTTSPQYPATIGGYFAGIVEIDPGELGTTPALTVAVVDGDGRVVGFEGSMILSLIRERVIAGAPMRVPFVVPFTAAIPAPMSLALRVTAGDGSLLASVPFIATTPYLPAPPT